MRVKAIVVALTLAAVSVRCSGSTGANAPARADAAAGANTGDSGGSDSGSSSGRSGEAGPTGGSAGSAGVGAASGASGASGADSGPANDRGPTPAIPGSANFPFPQNRESALCTYPAYRNADVRRAYERWKRETVTADGASGHLRVKRLTRDLGLEPGSTVSEGIAYGMLIAVYMNDQPLFDELWKYEQRWVNGNGLMDWYINAAGTERLGTGAASDADEDMAWALLMADRQWGGHGSLTESYLELARAQIDRIWQHEIHESKLLKPGDAWGDWDTINPSYFAPSYYRAFGEVTGNTAAWEAVIKTVYDTIDNTLNETNGNITNGLVPAWCTSRGAPRSAFAGAPTHYQYDSCRTPFRIALDYCLRGEPRAKAYVAKTSQFFSAIGAKNIVDGYDLDGTPRAANPSGQSAAFVGPAAVGAMADPAHRSLLEEGYAAVATYELLVGGEYYDGSWTVLSLLVLSGNFLDYTQHQPLTR
jgi:endo-1,4-beta-D-glucanase Y